MRNRGSRQNLEGSLRRKTAPAPPKRKPTRPPRYRSMPALKRVTGPAPLRCLFHVALIAAIALMPPTQLVAQEIVGKRLFSDQLVIPEPFVEDEISLPTILYVKRGRVDGQRAAHLVNIDGEIKKRITENLEISLGGGVTHVDDE